MVSEPVIRTTTLREASGVDEALDWQATVAKIARLTTLLVANR
jgi:hypothetical protein